MEMTPVAVSALAGLLERRTGQQLAAARRWRLESVLAPILRANSIASLDALAGRIAMNEDPTLSDQVVEALLNHETSFYRDPAAFGSLVGEALPALAAARGATRRLRIWSAGCSTGQEPYSLAMSLTAGSRWRDWQVDIIGTDVSPTAIAQAREGRYSQFEAQRGMPIAQLITHFAADREASWRINPDLRARVTFMVHNLLEPLNAGSFDMILCRNILLYFEPERRRLVFERLARAIAPDGLLMLGAGETILNQTDAFVPDPALKGFYRARRI